MKSMLYITNLPAPYKIEFLNELGKYVSLTVAFERASAENRDPRWKGTGDSYNFSPIWLTGYSIGTENSLDCSIVRYLRKTKYDLVLLNGYSSLTEMIAISYMKRRSVPFGIACDGMFEKNDSLLKKRLKTRLISSALFWLSPGHITDKALVRYGADPKRIHRYPFTSIKENDIVAVPYDRDVYKKKVGCDSTYMILYVGQMIHRKGIDVLLEAIDGIESDCTTYLIGGKLTDVPWDRKVVNIGFLDKKQLADYYKAADVFVLPSREDIWGLVVNEAMAYGTPVIGTDRCGAALEMIKDDMNGAVISANDATELHNEIVRQLSKNKISAMLNSSETARRYTIEKMAKSTLEAAKRYW